MHVNMYKKFLVSVPCGDYPARVWIKHNADDYAHAALKGLSIWKGADKQIGQLVGYELSDQDFDVALRLLNGWGYDQHLGGQNAFD